MKITPAEASNLVQRYKKRKVNDLGRRKIICLYSENKDTSHDYANIAKSIINSISPSLVVQVKKYDTRGKVLENFTKGTPEIVAMKDNGFVARLGGKRSEEEIIKWVSLLGWYE